MIALDTNLLVHAHRKDAALHVEAKQCVQDLAAGGKQWAICYHNLVEFYGISTHRRLWRRSSPPGVAMEQIKAWQESPSHRLLSDTETSLQWLEQLCLEAKVSGPLVHDARIAACCLSHGVAELWTVDRDFSRFPQLKTRNPLAV